MEFLIAQQRSFLSLSYIDPSVMFRCIEKAAAAAGAAMKGRVDQGAEG
jgi:hypothetical protein